MEEMNMTQLQFNLNLNVLKERIMESNMDVVVKSAIILVLNEYMEKERDDYLQAGAYERAAERVDYRNGYYERELMLSLGKITLKVPRTRNGAFSPTIFERYSRVDQAFALSMMEMVINGVSTRKVSNIVEQLCGEQVSKSFVSSLTEKLDPIVKQWAQRPLNIEYYPYIFVDAMYIKVREHHKVVSKAVYIASAINEANQRKVIGFNVNHKESYEAWKEFFLVLKSRGLQSPKLVISDAHKGLKKAIAEEFIGTSWQRCTVHFKRNIIGNLPKKNMASIILDLKRIFEAVEIKDARNFRDEFFDKYKDENKLEKALEILDEGFEDAIQYLNQPAKWHRLIRTTNSLERINQEVRRREKVIRIFPNTQSAFRLIGAVLMEYDDLLSKRRVNFEEKK